MATKTVLTGKKRCRILARMFHDDLLILQVQTHTTGWYEEVGYYGGSKEVDYKKWRDATVEDLTEGLVCE